MSGLSRWAASLSDWRWSRAGSGYPYRRRERRPCVISGSCVVPVERNDVLMNLFGDCQLARVLLARAQFRHQFLQQAPLRILIVDMAGLIHCIDEAIQALPLLWGGMGEEDLLVGGLAELLLLIE